MLVPVRWLEEYIGSTGDIKEFSDKMIMSGSNIETVEPVLKNIENVVVGKVLSCEKHQDADKLKVCRVEVADGKVLQIVCGAPNVKEGLFVPVAMVGAKLPGGIEIKEGELRGVLSQGMICSAKELGLNDKVIPVSHKDGIWTLPEDLELGADVVTATGLDDFVIDFEITPNRADCLSMIGMAREGAVTLGKEVVYPDFQLKNMGEGSVGDYISVEIADETLCNRYVAKVVKDVVIKESPWWLQCKLIKAGVRPINNIVDITNLVMLETGQPLHAFDMKQIKSGKIVVGPAEIGEKFRTLDDEERILKKGDTLIKDGDRPVALGGIMGGLNSEVENDTTSILIESANFNKDKIRKTSKELGLRTESSSRFEKGVDAEICHVAADRACNLIELIDAGKVVSGSIDMYPCKTEPKVCSVRPERINKVLGTEISAEYMTSVFEALGISIEKNGDMLKAVAPTFRPDLEIEEDYIEEIARIYGYDKLPTTLPKGDTAAYAGEKEEFRGKIRNIMSGVGFREIETYSFVSPKSLDLIDIEEDSWERSYIRLENPLGKENSIMRTLLTPSMLETLGRNFSRNIEEAFAYEIGSVFCDDGEIKDGANVESEAMAIGAYGPDFDFFSMKGVIEELLLNLGIRDVAFEREEEYGPYHPGRCARIIVKNSLSKEDFGNSIKDMQEKLSMIKGGEEFDETELEALKNVMSEFTQTVFDMPIELGIMGEIKNDVSKKMGIGTRAYCCELFLDTLREVSDTEKKYSPLPKFPATTRDIALVVDEDIQIGQLTDTINSRGGKLLEEVKLFDIYRGKQVEEGKKSVAFSLKYRNLEKTITDDEVQAVHKEILKSLEEDFNATLREI